MNPADWTTLRELDQAAAQSKGSAFRCFKQLAPTLQEGRDFVVLDSDDPGAAPLREAGRVYAQSLKLILLSAPTAATIRALLQSAAH